MGKKTAKIKTKVCVRLSDDSKILPPMPEHKEFEVLVLDDMTATELGKLERQLITGQAFVKLKGYFASEDISGSKAAFEMGNISFTGVVNTRFISAVSIEHVSDINNNPEINDNPQEGELIWE